MVCRKERTYKAAEGFSAPCRLFRKGNRGKLFFERQGAVFPGFVLGFDDAIASGDLQRQLRNFQRKCIVSEENAKHFPNPR